jgi:hypothetical protein
MAYLKLPEEHKFIKMKENHCQFHESQPKLESQPIPYDSLLLLVLANIVTPIATTAPTIVATVPNQVVLPFWKKKKKKSIIHQCARLLPR